MLRWLNRWDLRSRIARRRQIRLGQGGDAISVWAEQDSLTQCPSVNGESYCDGPLALNSWE